MHSPGVDIQLQNGPGSNANIAIRGVALNDFNDGPAAPVTAFTDEFYIGPMSAVDLLMYDLDRVEVLRDPQGTLFGRNATGGLVHWLTNKPAPEFEAYDALTLAEHDQVKFEGAVNVPLNDRLYARVPAATNEHDGWLDIRCATKNFTRLMSSPDVRNC